MAANHSITAANTGNSFHDKHVFLYDGHSRKPGVSKANDTRQWRKLRRAVKRWLTQRMEAW